MNIAALRANRAVSDTIYELDVEKRRERRMQLNAVSPKFAVLTNLAVERSFADGDGPKLPFDSSCAIEKLAEIKHFGA